MAKAKVIAAVAAFALADAAKARDYLRENDDAIGVDDLSDDDAVAKANAHVEAAKAAAEGANETKAAAPADHGTARVKHTGGATSASFDGVTYEADKNGVFTVPHAAVAALAPHGFELA